MATSVAVKQLTLREARGNRGWTMDKLAERSGVHKATISRIESGEICNPSNDTVANLETALRLKRGTLVFGQVMEKAS